MLVYEIVDEERLEVFGFKRKPKLRPLYYYKVFADCYLYLDCNRFQP